MHGQDHTDAGPLVQLLGARGEGGAETYFVTLAQAFHRAGIAQHFVIRAHAERQAALASLGPVIEAPFRSFLDFSTKSAISAALNAAQAPVALAWMSRAARHTPSGPWARIGRLGGYYPLKNFAGFDHLVGNTQDVVDYIIANGWPAARTHLIPNLVRSAVAAPEPRAAHTTPDGAPLLLGVGRLHPNKAHDISLKALAQLPDAYLWIAGAGPERAALEARAADLGVAARVRFLGWRAEVAPLLAAADLCVFPSRAEPLGNVVLECWAQGLAIVAARSEGPSRLIEDGVNGALVPVDDADALARTAAALLNAPAQRAAFITAGKARLVRDFAEAAIIAQWRDLFARAQAGRV